MYVDLEYRQERTMPEYEYINTTIADNMRRFFSEYKSRLSKTVQMRLAELAEYIRRESNGNMLKAERVIKILTSPIGREAPETAKMAYFAANLHRGFDHREVVSCPELILLLYRYGGYDNAG
jgi:hypothetical protein